jgi:DNA uptake protein ComE-like DNA-binding protein
MKHLWMVCPLALVLILALGGCNNSADQQANEEKARDDAARAAEKTRDEVAKATEQAKPALQEAGREIGAAAHEAAGEAKAAAQGVREGWNRGKNSQVDVNGAGETELITLPGIGHHEAQRIIDARPYHDKHEVVSKGAITQSEYDRIRDMITAK